MSGNRFPRRRTRLIAAVAAAAGALVLAACSSPASDTTTSASADAPAEVVDQGELNLQLSWIKNKTFAGEYFADTEGYYEEEGFSAVNLIPGPSTGVAELLSGSADVAISDLYPTAAAIATEGAPLKIIGTSYQRNPLVVLSMADGANIQTVDDLVGKRIGVQYVNQSSFDALLAANDIDPSQVEVVPVEFDPSPLVAGEVDGYLAYATDQSATLEVEGYDVTNLYFADNGLPFISGALVTTDQMIAENPEFLKALLRAEIRGWSAAVNDPEEAGRLAAEVYGADLGLSLEGEIAGATAQVDLVWTDETSENGILTISPDLQATTIESLAILGLTLDAEQLFDLSLLDEVLAEDPSLKELVTIG